MVEDSRIAAVLEDIPGLMKALTEEFIAKTELSERAKIRLRMKALLDFVSVDTTYPKIPNLDGRPAPAAPAPAIGHALTPEVALGAPPIGQAVATPVFPAPGLAP